MRNTRTKNRGPRVNHALTGGGVARPFAQSVDPDAAENAPRKIPRKFGGDTAAERDWLASLYVCRSNCYPGRRSDMTGWH